MEQDRAQKYIHTNIANWNSMVDEWSFQLKDYPYAKKN